MVEMRMGRPLPSMKRRCLAASKLYAVSGSPPSTSDSLAVVPPMSKASTLPPLSSRPKKAAAMAPAAGADSSICTGARRAAVAFGDEPGRLPLVARIGVGVKEDNGDRGDPGVDEVPGPTLESAGVE